MALCAVLATVAQTVLVIRAEADLPIFQRLFNVYRNDVMGASDSPGKCFYDRAVCILYLESPF